MGLLQWLRSQRPRDPRRPWIRPEFLGFFTLLLVGLALLAFWQAHIPAQSPSGGESQAAQHAYVGMAPSQAGLPSICDPGCLLEEWKAAHPHATIVEARPVYFYQGSLVYEAKGPLLGFDVAYTE